MSLTFYWNTALLEREGDPPVTIPYAEDGTNRGGAPEPLPAPRRLTSGEEDELNAISGGPSLAERMGWSRGHVHHGGTPPTPEDP